MYEGLCELIKFDTSINEYNVISNWNMVLEMRLV